MIIPVIDRIAKEEGLDPRLAHAVYYMEHDPKKGLSTTWGDGGAAYGPFQLHAAAAKAVGVNRFDTEDNIRGGIRYYKQQLDATGDPVHAAVAYNRGPGMFRQIAAGRAPEDQVSAGKQYGNKFLKIAGELWGIKPAAAAERAPAGRSKAGESREEALYRALEEADRSGNAEDARAIADMIKAERAGSPQASNQTSHAEMAPQRQETAPAVTETAQRPSALESAAMGAGDVVMGAQQLWAHARPTSDAGRRLNELRGLAPKSADQIDADVASREAEYQKRLGADAGFDWWRTAGNIGASIPLSLFGGPVVSGAISGALQPVTGGDFYSTKAAQTAVGGAAGKVGEIITGALGKVIAPRVSQEVSSLRAGGVEPTIGQMIGPRAAKIEEKMTSLPVIGSAIADARKRATEQMNKLAMNKALEPTGKTVSAAGTEGISEVHSALSKAYDDLLPHLQFVPDKQFMDDVAGNAQMQALAPEQVKRVMNVFDRRVSDRLAQHGGALPGDIYKRVDSELEGLASGNGELAPAFKALRGAMRESLRRSSSPEAAAALDDIDRGFAEYAIIRDASSRTGSKEGLFSPEALSSEAMKSARTRVSKNVAAKREGALQDIGQASEKVLGRTIPDSGTAGRVLPWALPAGISGAGASMGLDPITSLLLGYGALGAGSSAYSRGGQNILRGILFDRPAGAQAARKAIEHAGQYAGIAAAPAGSLLMRLYGG